MPPPKGVSLTRPLYEWVTGKAGTGKSFHLQRMAEEEPGCILTSTTGISAVNIGGVTLHSLLWFYSTESLLDAWTTGKLDFRLGEVYNKLGVRRLCTDEISMLDRDAFTIICMAIDRLNNTLKKKGNPLFGWTLAGDYHQLSPINADFAFESEYWDRFEENTTYLNKIYRQKDTEFIEALQLVRGGKGKTAVEYFKDRIHKLIDPQFDGTTIYPYNSNVDRQNEYRLERVKGPKICFSSYKDGKQRPEWKYIPDTLELKLGALIMLLSNKYEKASELQYCNGDLGILEGRGKGTALVRLKRTNEVVEVGYTKRLNEEVSGNSKKVVGSINFLPARLAWASTCHKSQGITVDAAQVDFRSKFYRECPNMLYVALSRCRSKEGLRLVGGAKTFVQNCVTNPKLERFL